MANHVFNGCHRSRLPDRVHYHDEECGNRPKEQGQQPPIQAPSALRLCQTCIDKRQGKPADRVLTGISALIAYLYVKYLKELDRL